MRLNSIVIGIDFSETAVKSARWAAAHFAPSAVLTLVHVIDLPDRPRFARHLLPDSDATEAAARTFTDARLHAVAAELPRQPVRCEIRVGKPYEEITALAEEIAADLVVVGPHGDRPHQRNFLGTTAERVVRTSPVPVLVAISPRSAAPRQLLVPVEDFPVTEQLLSWTHDLAGAFDADVTLLHVWSNAVYSHVASMSYAGAHNEAEAKEDLDMELRDAGMHWLEELGRTGVQRDRVTAAVTYGNPGDATLEMAGTIGADLILLGRRGTGLVAPAILGSTVGTVLRDAPCPVLVVTEPWDTVDEEL